MWSPKYANYTVIIVHLWKEWILIHSRQIAGWWALNPSRIICITSWNVSAFGNLVSFFFCFKQRNKLSVYSQMRINPHTWQAFKSPVIRIRNVKKFRTHRNEWKRIKQLTNGYHTSKFVSMFLSYCTLPIKNETKPSEMYTSPSFVMRPYNAPAAMQLQPPRCGTVKSFE